MKAVLGKLLTRQFFYRPIFVVGDGRSGTSVLLQALGKHPLILSTPGEAPLITSVADIVHLLEYAQKPTRQYYAKSLRFTKSYLYDNLRRMCFEIAMGEAYGFKLCMTYPNCHFTSLVRKRYWCAKTFPPENIMKGLLKLYPSAKLIYILRNGIEVVQSKMRFHGFRA